MRRAVVRRARGLPAGGGDRAGAAAGGGCAADIGRREGAKPAPDKTRGRSAPRPPPCRPCRLRRAATAYVTRDLTRIVLRRQTIERRVHDRRIPELREAVGECP